MNAYLDEIFILSQLVEGMDVALNLVIIDDINRNVCCFNFKHLFVRIKKH